MTLRLDPALTVCGFSLQVACRVEVRVMRSGSGLTGQCRKEPVAICVSHEGRGRWYHIGPEPLAPATAAALLRDLEALSGDPIAP